MEEFDYKKFLIENRLTINSRLLAEVSIDMLKSQYVDSGDLEQEVFDKIIKASSNKSAYATWLAKKVKDEIIKVDDIYKFKEYFSIFDKNKTGRHGKPYSYMAVYCSMVGRHSPNAYDYGE